MAIKPTMHSGGKVLFSVVKSRLIIPPMLPEAFARLCSLPFMGYHGTTMKQLGERQIQEMCFDERNMRIYFHGELDVAIKYAQMKRDRDGSKPVVLQIGSKRAVLENEGNCEIPGRSKGWYQFFSPEGDDPVLIYSIMEELTDSNK